MVDYYILRSNTFARSANTKLLYTLGAICIAVQQKEYIILYTFSTGFWTFIEYLLVWTSIRKIKTMIFQPLSLLPCIPTLYNRKYKLNQITSAVLRGSMEGGFITTYSLYWADNILVYPFSFIGSLIVIFMHTLVLNYNTKISKNRKILPNNYNSTLSTYNNRNGKINHNSIRHVNSKRALTVLAGISIIDVYYLAFIGFQREIVFLTMMIIFGSVWTSAHYLCNTRQVLCCNTRPFTDAHAYIPNKTHVFLTYYFDVVVEIGIAYMPFYFLTQIFMGYLN